MECCDHSHAEIVNLSKTGGTIIQLDNHSTAEIVSETNVIHMMCWLWNNSTATFTNNSESIHLLDISAEGGSNLTFINNGTITNTSPDPDAYDGNEWGDYAVMLGVDASSRIKFTGSGSICPGTQMYDYYLRDPAYGPRPGPSVVFKAIMPEVTDDHEANLKAVLDIAENITFNWAQVEQQAGADHVLAVRRDEEDPNFTYVIDMKQSDSPAPDDPPAEKILLLPSGLQSLEQSAFEGCGAIQFVVVPESVTFIGEDSFKSCPGITLIVTPESYAHAYAETHGISYIFPN